MSRVSRHCVPVVIGVSLLVQLAAGRLLGEFEPRSVPLDYLNRYRPQAETILAGGGMLLNGEPRTPPAYPLALAGAIALSRGHGIGPDGAARLLNLVLMALAAALLTAAVRRAMGGRAALFAGLAFATYPFAVYLGLAPGPEPLYLFSLALTAWLIVATMGRNPWWAAAAGALAGYSMLVKPIGILLPFFYAAAYAAGRQGQRPPGSRLLRPALLISASCMTILPWQIYLSSRIVRPVVLSSLGSGTAREGWTYGLSTGAGGDRARLPGDVIALMQQVAREGSGVSATRLYHAIARAGAGRPAALAKLAALKLLRPWYATDEQWHEPAIAMVQAFYLLLAAAGFAVWRRERRGGILVPALLAIALCHWLMAFATFSILRYMMPASFLIAALAGTLADRLLPHQRPNAANG